MFTSVSVFFLALSLRTVKSDDPVYGAVGDEVVLKPGPVQGPITEIMWKHGQDLAMEQYQGSVEAFRQFKERGSLNVTTGALTITGLTPRDSGNYTAEINNKVASTTQLLVISRVSKPTVSTQCDADHCVFTCESNDITAEPVTYSWMAEEKSWISTKEIRITKDESEKQFHCELSNPVSTELSEPVINPFSTWKWYHTALIYGSILLIGFLIGFILYKRNKRKGKWYTRVLIICSTLLIGGLTSLIGFIGFNVLNLYYRNRIKGDGYYLFIIFGSMVLIFGAIFFIVFILKKMKKIKEPPRRSNRGPETNGPSETRLENAVSKVKVSMNLVPTPTASLENSKERKPLMRPSQDPESDVTSETSRKDETSLEIPPVQVYTNQTASEDTANETDMGTSPDQVLTDATNEAGV